MAKKILVTGTSVADEILLPLKNEGWHIDNPTGLLSEFELGEALTDKEAYLLGGDEIATRAALSKAQNLKIIAFLGMGYEKYVDSQAAVDLNIAVTNTPGTLSNAVADLTIGHLICSVRKSHYYASLFEAGQEGSEEKQRDIADLHHGILGMGGIGARVAQILRQGFGARVSYFSRTRKPHLEDSLGLEWLELDELISTVDSLTVLTQVNSETAGLVGEQELGNCKPGLVVVNTAGPSVVDPVALNSALDAGRVAYAAFDDFYKEQTSSAESLRKKAPARLMVTNHIGSLTTDARDAMGVLAVKSIIKMLNNGESLNRVA